MVVFENPPCARSPSKPEPLRGASANGAEDVCWWSSNGSRWGVVVRCGNGVFLVLFQLLRALIVPKKEFLVLRTKDDGPPIEKRMSMSEIAGISHSALCCKQHPALLECQEMLEENQLEQVPLLGVWRHEANAYRAIYSVFSGGNAALQPCHLGKNPLLAKIICLFLNNLP